MQALGNFINGKVVNSASERMAPVYNPATGEQALQVAISPADEIREAVRVAHEAFSSWSKVTQLEWSRIMFKFKALVEAHVDELARLIASEHGNVFSDAKGEVTCGLEVVEFACGIPQLQNGEHTMNVGTGVDSYVMMQEKVKDYIQSGVDEEVELVVDGREIMIEDAGEGFFTGGTLFDRVVPGMRIHSEEFLGPVLAIARTASFDEAASPINEHEYGNGTAIFTLYGDAARQFCEQFQVCIIGVNVQIPVPMAFHSFGGWNRSLYGLLHMHGHDGEQFYTCMKAAT